MPRLLAIFSSPRGEYSVSRKLTQSFADTWKVAHPSSTVTTRELNETELPWVGLPWIQGAFTPVEQHSPEVKEAIAVSNNLIEELKAADHIVIGTPMYNFSIPASLKSYVDQIVRVGVTFSASYEGLLKGKKLTIILASGGDYGPGSPTEGYNVAVSYLRQIFGFVGVTDVSVVLAGGTSAIDKGEKTLAEFVSSLAPTIDAAAHI